MTCEETLFCEGPFGTRSNGSSCTNVVGSIASGGQRAMTSALISGSIIMLSAHLVASFGKSRLARRGSRVDKYPNEPATDCLTTVPLSALPPSLPH